ncbi:MAG: hypothetical protein KA198_00600 [Chitinophagaceae bacterium]|nr:hypothetical protein [Chitinophagaceae bacterium]
MNEINIIPKAKAQLRPLHSSSFLAITQRCKIKNEVTTRHLTSKLNQIYQLFYMKNLYKIPLLCLYLSMLISACSKVSSQLPTPEVKSDTQKIPCYYKNKQVLSVYLERIKSNESDQVTLNIENNSQENLDSIELVYYIFNQKNKTINSLVFSDHIQIDHLNALEKKPTKIVWTNPSFTPTTEFIEFALVKLRGNSYSTNSFARIYNDGYLSMLDKDSAKSYSFAQGYIAADGTMQIWFNQAEKPLSIRAKLIDQLSINSSYLADSSNSILAPLQPDTLANGAYFQMNLNKFECKFKNLDTNLNLQTIHTFLN